LLGNEILGEQSVVKLCNNKITNVIARCWAAISAPIFRQYGYYVTGFVWVRDCSINKPQQWGDCFPWNPCSGVILKTIGAAGQFSEGDSHGKFVCEEELKTI
jgi:hypothetical protein